MLAVPQAVRPAQMRLVMDFCVPGYDSPWPTAMKICTVLQVAVWIPLVNSGRSPTRERMEGCIMW